MSFQGLLYPSSNFCTFPCKLRNIKRVLTYWSNLSDSITKMIYLAEKEKYIDSEMTNA